MRSLDYDSKYTELKQKVVDIGVKQELEQKHVKTQLSKLDSNQQILDSQINVYKDQLKDLLNFSSVINHIVIQDEIDRQGTALYALRSGKTEISPTPTYQLDPNCINCELKTSSVIQQAFKMACLTYNPSQIRIDEQLFSRQEILEISTNILEKLKKKLFNLETIRFS